MMTQQQQNDQEQQHNQAHGHQLHLTILVNGAPVERTYPPTEIVHAVVIDLLPAHEKAQADQFQLSSRNGPLNPALSLAANGVHDEDALSLTKKDGGGGAGHAD